MEAVAEQVRPAQRTAMPRLFPHLFCRHLWQLTVVGMFDEEHVRCAKCGCDRWEDEDDF